MAFISKETIKKAIGQGTIRPKILNQFFYSVKLKSYDYDYLIQEQLVDLTVHHRSFYDVVHHNDLVKNGVRMGHMDRCAICQIDKDIVHYAKRKQYKHTNFYNTPMTQDEMMTHRDVFKFGVVAFINGVITTDFKVQAREDNTFLLFNWAKYIPTVKPEDVIDIAFIPECLICTSRQMSNQDKATTTSIHDFVFENINRNYFKECKQFIVFFNPIAGGDSVLRTGVTYDTDNRRLVFAEEIPGDLSKFTMTAIGMEDLVQVIDVAASESYLRIERRKMPIPKNNLLILVANDNGYGYHVNTNEVSITEYYPNIYKVNNPNAKKLKILVLYEENPQNELIEYDDEISYFLKKVDLLQRYKENNVPDGLREYKPVPWDYLMEDYEDKSGVVTPTGDKWIPFLYKINKINSVYKVWCYFFQSYLKQTYGFLDGWIYDTTNEDMSDRERMDTNPEIPTGEEEYKIFNETHYLFTYRNDWGIEDNIPYAWFIDGRFAVPTYSVSLRGYQFVYFPKALFNDEGSLVEVERYDGSVWSKKLAIGEGKTLFKVNWLDAPTIVGTMFLTTESGEYISPGDHYKLSVIDDVGLDIDEFDLDLKESVYLLQNGMTIAITPKDEQSKNKNIYLNCNNRAVVYDRDVRTMTIFEDINLNDLRLINRTKQDIKSRLRIYNPEGRMYPRDSYITLPKDNIEEPPEFSIMVDTTEGTPFKIEYMGYDDKLIYQQENIEPNGLLNLEGKIDKPFSLVYHDVFLNGYKLNKTHIEIVSPFCIVIKNVHTIHNLRIYERVKGEELFVFDQEESSQYLADQLLKDDPEYYQTILEGLSDIVIDPSIEDIDEQVTKMIGLIREFIMENNIDGDTEYPPELLEEYDELFGDDWRLLLNADHRIEQNVPPDHWFYLSHDLNIAYNNK